MTHETPEERKARIRRFYLWDPKTNTRLNLYLVSFNIGPSGDEHAGRVLVAAIDEEDAREIALGDEDEEVATIKDVTHLGQTPKGSTLEPGILMAEPVT